MDDLRKTKKQLVDELHALRARVALLEREASAREVLSLERDEQPFEYLPRLSLDSTAADGPSVAPGESGCGDEGRACVPAEILCIAPSPAMESLAQVCEDLGHHCTRVTDWDSLRNLQGHFHLAVVAVKPGGHALFNGPTLHDLMVHPPGWPMVERGLLLGNMDGLRGHVHAYEQRASGYCQIGDPERPMSPDLLARIRCAIVDVLRLPAYEPVNFFDEVDDGVIHSVIESSQAPILVFDTAWRVWFANLSAHAVFRRSSQFLKGLHLDELLADPREGRVFRESVARGLGRGGGEIECRLRSRDGHEFDALIWYNPIYHEGLTQMVGCTFTDITRRKQAEAELKKAHQLLQERFRLQGDELFRASEQLELRAQEQDLTRQALDRQRRLLQTLIDHLPDQIYVKDRESRFHLVNRAVLSRFGLSNLSELIGKTDADFFPPDLAQQYLQEERHILETGEPLVNAEQEARYPGKAPMWTLVTKVPLRDERTGEVVGFVGLNRDITHLKQMEQEMLAAERQHRAVLDAMTDAIHVIDRDYRIVLVNQAFRNWIERLGIRAEPVGRLLTEAVPLIPESSLDQYRKVFDSGENIESELETRVQDASVVLEIRKIPIIESDQVVRVATILRDITERRRVEESFQRSEARIRQMVESLPIALCSVEADTGRVLLLEGDTEDILGYDHAQIFSDPHLGAAIVHPEDRRATYAAFEEGMASRKPFSMTYRIIHGKRRTPVYLQRYVVPVHDSNNRLVRHDSIIIDVTAEREAEQRLKLLSQVVEQTSEGVAVVDLDGKVLFLNRACAAMHGGGDADFLGKPLSVFHTSEQASAVYQAIRQTVTEGEFEDETGHVRKDGSTFFASMRSTLLRNESGAPMGCIVLMRDITAWRAMQSASVRLAEAVKNAGEGIAIWDGNWHLTYANASMLAMLGCSSLEELEVLKAFRDSIRKGEGHGDNVLAGLHKTGVWRGRLRTERKDGSVVSLAATFSRLVQDDGGELVVGNFTDMSREEAQLEQIRRLGREAAALLDKERARLSRELHDELGQQLTAMNLALAWLESHLAAVEPPIRERLSEVRDLQTRMTETVRNLAKSLRPAVFDYQTLPEALQSLITEYGQSGGLTCRVKAEPPNLNVQNPLKTTIYRITQEALTNVLRHSNATRCEVKLRATPRGIELRVTDNGTGADPSKLEGTASLGIVGMRERATALGGELRVESLRRGGVRVLARFPWPRNHQP